MSGTLNLKHNGSIVVTQRYQTAGIKAKILSKWAKIYGAGFKYAQVEDIPDEKPEGYERHFKKGDEKLTRGLNGVSKPKGLDASGGLVQLD